jgi:uncharacterized membrane protein
VSIASPASLLSKHRLEALSDGIFAVAMTLLVIELKVPNHGIASSQALATAVLEQLPTFVAWAISFFVLAIFWTTQSRLFHFVGRVNEPMTWLMIAYLGLVSLMPFSSALAGEYAGVSFAQIVYSAHMILLATFSLLLVRYLCRHPELWATELPPRLYHGARFRTLSLMAVAVIAIAINAAAPGFGSTAFILMFPLTRIGRRLERG